MPFHYGKFVETDEDHDSCGPEERGTTLIGYKKGEDGLYAIDQGAAYSAIIGQVYAQITGSTHVSRCALCSPCYPGQGDLDTPGEYLTFTLPPDVWGEAEHLPLLEARNARIRCKISWIDSKGNHTPDDNPAVGVVYSKEYTAIVAGREVLFPQTEEFPICEQHVKRLNEPGMEHWVFVPWAEAQGGNQE